MTRSKLQVAAAGVVAVILAVAGPVLMADPSAKAEPPTKSAAAEPKAPAPAAKPKELLALEQKLVGKWVGRGMFAAVVTYRADGTYTQTFAGLKESFEGTWAFEWDALPPTLVTRTARSDHSAVQVGTVFRRKVLALDDKQLSVEYPEAAGDGALGVGVVGYRRAADAPAASDKPAAAKPARSDVVGEWRSHNGLAGVFFTLELKDDGGFILSHYEVAPKLDLRIAGKWSLDGDRVTLREEQQMMDGKRIEVEGRLFFPRGRTDTVAVARKDGRWVVTHGGGLEFTRYVPEKAGRPGR